MEGLPRAPHSGDRKVASRESRDEPVYRQPEPQQASDYPRVPRSSNSRNTEYNKPSKKGIIWAVSVALLVIVLAVAGWLLISVTKSQPTGIDSGRYQAVFLANGQIYFGKLQDFNDSSFKMTKIYYPQTTGEDAADTTAVQSQNSGIQLIRLGDEVHGPDNEMYLVKDQILYYENLKSDSKVSQLIDQNEASK